MQVDTKKRIGILRGGAGEEYYSSLKRGGDIIAHILEKLSDKYKPVDILVDKDYLWHYNGLPIIPSDLMHKVDVVWNVAHPSLSNILQSLSIPHIGAGNFLGSLMSDRNIFKEYIKSIGVYMPRHVISPKTAREVFEKFGAPWIIKSFDQQGWFKAQTFGELAQAIENGVNHGESIVVEEFISDKVATAYSVANFRNEDVYVLSPDNLVGVEKEKIINTTKNLHKYLDAKHYLKMDYVLHPKRGVFLTNIEFTPDLCSGSHLEKSCESIGAKMHDVVEHILEQTL